MLSNLYSEYHAQNGMYYQEPEGATSIVDSRGNFQGYQNHSHQVIPVSSLNGMSESHIGYTEGHQAAVTSMDETYYRANNGMYYEEPKGVTNIVNMRGNFVGYQNSMGEVVSVTGLNSLTQAQYNQLGMNAG
jgi:hypothetical protein